MTNPKERAFAIGFDKDFADYIWAKSREEAIVKWAEKYVDHRGQMIQIVEIETDH